MADKALMAGAFGGRGTGKTTWLKGWIRESGYKRIVIWDYKHDPNLEDMGKPVSDMRELLQVMKRDQFFVRYLVDRQGLCGLDKHEQFRFFCLACWEASNLLMFVDELPEVTKANMAPEEWRTCVNVGREYKIDGVLSALTICIAAQRPSECDKSTIGNCDIIHSGRVRGNDAKVLAIELGCQASDLVNLPDFHFIELGPGDTTFRRGQVTKKGTVASQPDVKNTPSAKKVARKQAR
jgi:hypothetical protein